MKEFRKYSERYPFRQRSETPEIAVELSLQCWRRFGMDGVIFFSDILTPLPAMGIEFDVVRGRGPLVLGDLARCLKDRLSGPRNILRVTDSEDYLASHGFIREILQTLRKETEGNCALLGFVGAPWTLAAYAVEGGSTKDAAHFKKWMYEQPAVADEFLERCTDSIANYGIFQARSGAQCIQIFDSWAHCLSPEQWQRFAAPHVRRVAQDIRAACPDIPIIYFANGGSSYMRDQVEVLNGVVDVLGVDGRARLGEARRAVEGSGLVLQGNVDSFVLRHGSEADIRDAVRRAIDDAGGPGRHIMNLGHGVLQGTPEESVAHFVEEAQTYGAA
jgi:uroporphyrinogen decarboxylase